jgi:hypothetical protein
MSNVLDIRACSYEQIISEICEFGWPDFTEHDMICAARAYYFFSVQFRENLQLACELFPANKNLKLLKSEECDTDNLSPFPHISISGEKLNHDEFVRRLLELSPVTKSEHHYFNSVGDRYLNEIRDIDPMLRALSIASYEDGGIERVFTAILTAPEFTNSSLKAFRFFMREHIRFDTDLQQRHDILSKQLLPDDRVVPFWAAFKRLFIECVPRLLKTGLPC